MFIRFLRLFVLFPIRVQNMTLKDWISSSTLVKASIILWLVSAGFIVFLLGQIDTIVHKVLYNYGLQFSEAWAIPYWGMLRSIYIFLAVPSFLSGALLVLSIHKSDSGEKRTVKHEEKPPSITKPQPMIDNHLYATCPKCKKVFSKPLTMLDFSGGKTRLVNVCPYCSYILGTAEEEKDLTEVVVPDAHAEKVPR
jgi:hypothetical protein